MPEDIRPAAGSAPEEVTALLEAARGGDAAAQERLFGAVYSELKRIARRHLRGRRPGDSLQTTGLVHEAYLRLARPVADADFKDRVHFFAVASRAMRQILIDHVRARQAKKRAAIAVPLDEADGAAEPEASWELLELDRALVKLEQLDPRLGRMVELRFFGGMSVDEVGAALEVSETTVKRDWRAARAFLYAELGGQAGA